MPEDNFVARTLLLMKYVPRYGREFFFVAHTNSLNGLENFRHINSSEKLTKVISN